MPELRNIKCTIHTAQGELAEFEDKNPDNTVGQKNAANTITRYLNITGTAGERFWVELEIQPGFRWEHRFNCLCPNYIVDGIKLQPGSSFEKDKLRKQYHGPAFTKEVNGKVAGFTSNMFFRELKVVDHEVNGENTVSDKSVKELGRIEVTLGRGFYQLTDVMSSSDQMYKSVENVHEKVLKGQSISHGVHLDGERPATLLYKADTIYFDTMEAPYVKFVFLYHTHESLQNLGVIPRSSSPDVEIQQPTLEQLKQEIQRLASQLSQKQATLKRRLGEADDNDVESKGTIKNEKGASSRSSAIRKVKAAKVEIVDLTNED